LALPEQNTIVGIEVLSRADEDDDWRPRARTVAYRLKAQGHEVQNPEISFAPGTDRYWKLRVDQKGGGLGTGTPEMHAGWLTRKIIFAAPGTGPFVLAYGSGKAQPAAYAIQTLVPGWRQDEQPRLSTAVTLPERVLGGPAALKRPVNYRVWVLWGTLVASVLLLAWMAWRLAGQLRKEHAPNAKDPPTH
jgi:hypothetical protein